MFTLVYVSINFSLHSEQEGERVELPVASVEAVELFYRRAEFRILCKKGSSGLNKAVGLFLLNLIP
jgi:hypothetical protein